MITALKDAVACFIKNQFRRGSTRTLFRFQTACKTLDQGAGRQKSGVYKCVHEHFLPSRNAEIASYRPSGSEKVVGRVGIEPTTGRLKAECSTSELTPHLGTWWPGCHQNAGGMIPDTD